MVRTRQGDFTGVIQWNQQDSVSTDALDGRTGGRALSLRYDTVRSIARHSRDSALVTLVDGSEIALSGAREVGQNNRGVYVDDTRYGRVLILGRVRARRLQSRRQRSPRRCRRQRSRLRCLSARATARYPRLIASIVPPGRGGRGAERGRVTLPGRVVLRDGETLSLERSGDLGDGNAGMLVFVVGGEQPEYVPWTEIEQIDFDRQTDVVGASS